jgi:uncharacterized protein (DUF433 family)
MTDQKKIVGTRITIPDVYYYLQAGRDTAEIADILGLSQCQVQEAMSYIREHEEDVKAIHAKVENRIARGNSPDVEARKISSRAKLAAWQKNGHGNQESANEGHPGGR